MLATLRRVSTAFLLAAFATTTPVSAEVVRIDVQSRGDLAPGMTFGAAGSYEKISGRIYFAVDPAVPANRIVADLDKAPRNAAGKVEFSSDFFLIKPKQIERGNGAVLYEVSNRGGKGMLGFFNHGTGSLDPASAADMGDGFLMKQGFTLLWVGWQFDPPKRAGLVRVYPPTASDTLARRLRAEGASASLAEARRNRRASGGGKALAEREGTRAGASGSPSTNGFVKA